MFQDRLRELRIKKGLTQEELAKNIHVSRSAVCKWEMGNGIPSDVNIEGICKYFNVSEEWLLDREDLKLFIKKSNNIKNKTLIISIVGMLVSLLCILFSFVGLFRIEPNNFDDSYLAIMMYPKSIYNVIELAIIVPLIIYAINLTISAINILKLIKVELVNRILSINIIFTSISILSYIFTFVLSIILLN